MAWSEALDHFGRSWGLPEDDAEREYHVAVAGVLAGLLATTTRWGSPAFSPAELVDAAGDRESGVALLGLAFVEDHAWSGEFLGALAGSVLLPLNREVLDTGLVDACYFGVAGDAVDGRVLLLAAIAESRSAVLLLPTLGDLAPLFDSEVAYGDGGRALAALVAAATLPASEADVAALAPVVTALMVGAGRVDGITAPVAGAFAAHAGGWVASFGSSDFDRRDVPDPLPDLTPDEARAFLDRVMAHEDAARIVRSTTLVWALEQVASIGADPDPLVAAHAASVWRAVNDAGHRADIVAAASEDDRLEADRYLIELAVSIGSGVAPGGHGRQPGGGCRWWCREWRGR